MLRIVQIALLITAGVGFVVAIVSLHIYVRAGGVPTRPHFEVQRTPRERQLARWNRVGSYIAGAAILALVLIDIVLRMSRS